MPRSGKGTNVTFCPTHAPVARTTRTPIPIILLVLEAIITAEAAPRGLGNLLGYRGGEKAAKGRM